MNSTPEDQNPARPRGLARRFPQDARLGDHVVLQHRHEPHAVISATIREIGPDTILLDHDRGISAPPVRGALANPWLHLKYDAATGLFHQSLTLRALDDQLWDEGNSWRLAHQLSENALRRALVADRFRSRLWLLQHELEKIVGQPDFGEDLLRRLAFAGGELRERALLLLELAEKEQNP